jgi:hypothetical protein
MHQLAVGQPSHRLGSNSRNTVLNMSSMPTRGLRATPSDRVRSLLQASRPRPIAVPRFLAALHGAVNSPTHAIEPNDCKHPPLESKTDCKQFAVGL